MAGMQAQAASETMQRVQEEFRNASSAREMYAEDVRLLERDKYSYEVIPGCGVGLLVLRPGGLLQLC